MVLDLVEKYGVKAKRQDGRRIAPAQLQEIALGLDEIQAALGPLWPVPMRDLLASLDPTIAHTSGLHPFMESAGGLYSPAERCLSVGVICRITHQPIPSLAHELWHCLDTEAGRRLGACQREWRRGRRAPVEIYCLSESPERGAEGEEGLIRRAQRSIADTSAVVFGLQRLTADRKLALTEAEQAERERTALVLGHYWREPREVSARLFEQFVAERLGRGGVAVSGDYALRSGYWRAADWETLRPGVERMLRRRLAVLAAGMELAGAA